ncbi:MAG: SDR family oxidoreductase [Bacteroidales bacterium]|nr:SDR family oxidoreductase [Bacteroidales bacterium]
MKPNQYGKVVFLESASVKQPIDNLTLSNSLRMAIVGLSKSLSKEYLNYGIRFNVIAPGYHKTSAVNRLVKKRAENEAISEQEALQRIENSLPLKTMGLAEDFASLTVWLLSPLSDYVTGQVYAVDGGFIASN